MHIVVEDDNHPILMRLVFLMAVKYNTKTISMSFIFFWKLSAKNASVRIILTKITSLNYKILT